MSALPTTPVSSKLDQPRLKGRSSSMALAVKSALISVPRSPPKKPTATGSSPKALSTLATFTDLPTAPSNVRAARLTASSTRLGNIITRWAAGVAPIQRIIIR